MEQNGNFTQGKILPALIRFSLPLLAAMLLQALYGAVDLVVVGRFGDATGVSAVATGSQMIQAITGIIIGLTMGPTVLIAQHIGAKHEKDAADVIGTTVWLFAGVALVITACMLLFTRGFVSLMNAPPEAFEKTVSYVLICGAGAVFIVAYNAISGIFRGMGDSKTPLLFVAIACVVNVLGDLLLVGVFHLDAAGAAMATVGAQAVSVVLSVIIIRRRGFPFAFSKKNVVFQPKVARRILLVGAPIALQDGLTNISFLIITGILNAMGLVVSAGVGVAEKLVVFVMLVPAAYMSAVSAFVAQNIGAGRRDRAYRAMLCGIGISMCFGVIMFAASFWKGDVLAGFFSKDAAVIAAAAEYMKAYAIDCIVVCVLFSMMGYFNGRGKTLFVMAQGLVAAFLVRIPFSYFMSRTAGATMFRIGLAAPLATGTGLVLCLIYFAYTCRQDRREPLISDK